MRNLKMSWYTAGDELVCRWVDSQEQETNHEALTSLTGRDDGSKNSNLSAEVQVTELGIGKAA
jgi:hypothetical protein